MRRIRNTNMGGGMGAAAVHWGGGMGIGPKMAPRTGPKGNPKGPTDRTQMEPRGPHGQLIFVEPVHKTCQNYGLAKFKNILKLRTGKIQK